MKIKDTYLENNHLNNKKTYHIQFFNLKQSNKTNNNIINLSRIFSKAQWPIYSKITLVNIRWVALWFYPCTLYYVRLFSSKISLCNVYICLICVLVWNIIRLRCTSYLRRHWLIPVLQNFRQRFFGLSVSDHGIVWFDIWSKCKLYCVPSLRSIITVWDILFSVFCFSIYFLKAWFLVEKVGFLVIIFSARKWRERRILHHLHVLQSFRGSSPLP